MDKFDPEYRNLFCDDCGDVVTVVEDWETIRDIERNPYNYIVYCALC